MQDAESVAFQGVRDLRFLELKVGFRDECPSSGCATYIRAVAGESSYQTFSLWQRLLESYLKIQLERQGTVFFSDDLGILMSCGAGAL